MGPINSGMDLILKDNGMIINLKVMDKYIPKMAILFQQVIGKIKNNKENIY